MGTEEWNGEICHGAVQWSYLRNLKCSRAGGVGMMPHLYEWRMVLPLTNRRGRRGAQGTFCSLLISGTSWDRSLDICSSFNRDEIALPCVHFHEKKGFGLVSSLLRK